MNPLDYRICIVWKGSCLQTGHAKAMVLCCRAGLYKLPWDMTTFGHRQTNPLFVLRKVHSFEVAGKLLQNCLQLMICEPTIFHGGLWRGRHLLWCIDRQRRSYVRRQTLSAAVTGRQTPLSGWIPNCIRSTTGRHSTIRCVFNYMCHPVQQAMLHTD